MKYSGVFLGLLALVLSSVAVFGSSFERTKRKLASSNCIYYQFVTTVESKVFDVVDTAYCTAYIAKDGRFRVEVGPDYFIFNGDSLYSYSFENNQVVIEQPDPDDPVSSEISFVMKLEEWYDSSELKEKNTYKLVKRKGIEGEIPDSMIMSIDKESTDIKTIQYFDQNGDLNNIIITNQVIDTACNSDRFIPDYPDSVEKIRF
jgi:outer membrane lipoprotein-sorting protein